MHNGHRLGHPPTIFGKGFQEHRIFSLCLPGTFNEHIPQGGVPSRGEARVELNVTAGSLPGHKTNIGGKTIQIFESIEITSVRNVIAAIRPMPGTPHNKVT